MAELRANLAIDWSGILLVTHVLSVLSCSLIYTFVYFTSLFGLAKAALTFFLDFFAHSTSSLIVEKS